MIIYITQKQIQDKHGQSLDALESKYIDYFLKQKLFPENAVFVPVPNLLSHAIQLIESIKPQYIIFTGGNNVKPPVANDLVDDLCPTRDEVEQFLIHFADSNQIPKLAICRGFQFLNVYYGGKLHYFLPEHASLRKHMCIYKNEAFMVNSYHQHGIYSSQLSQKLIRIAQTNDIEPIVEAYTNKSHDISPTLGVQWHPERDDIKPDLFKMIWEKFVNESSHFSRGHGQAAP